LALAAGAHAPVPSGCSLRRAPLAPASPGRSVTLALALAAGAHAPVSSGRSLRRAPLAPASPGRSVTLALALAAHSSVSAISIAWSQARALSLVSSYSAAAFR